MADLKSINTKRKIEPEVLRILEELVVRARNDEIIGFTMVVEDSVGMAYKCAGLTDRYRATGILFYNMCGLQSDKSDK